MSQLVHRPRLGTFLFTCGCFVTASAQMIPPSSQSSGCPIKVEDYVIGQATVDLVKRCLGTPRLKGEGDQGQTSYIYAIGGLGDVSFLFDKAGTLLRVHVHDSLM